MVSLAEDGSGAVSAERSSRAELHGTFDVARTLLRERGGEFLGITVPLDRIALRRSGSAILARLHVGEEIHRLVLKTLSPDGCRACDLVSQLGALIRSSPRIVSSLPPILGCDDESRTVVLGYVEGATLLSMMRQRLRLGATATEGCDEYFRQAAECLAEVHRVPADAVLPRAEARENVSYVATLKAAAVRLVPVFERAGFSSPDALLSRLSPAFFSRRGDRVFLSDARPKNLIVRPSGRICLIDLDISRATPVLGVALFMASLDRIGTRYPGRRAQRLLTAWQRVFVRAYADHAGDVSVGEDITFFYPWALLQLFVQHRAQRPSLTIYLRWYYGRRLDAFLRRLSERSPEDVAGAPFELFAAT